LWDSASDAVRNVTVSKCPLNSPSDRREGTATSIPTRWQRLPGEVAQEMMQTVQRVERCLRKVYRPDGMNFGLNLGEAAGPGSPSICTCTVSQDGTVMSIFMTVIGKNKDTF
jgi:hypothetical protein